MPRGLVLRALFLFCGLSLGMVLASVSANADSDYHDSVAGPGSARASLARLALQNSEVELVAVGQGRHLLIYLDRFEDGVPIDGAVIDIAAGDNNLRAIPLDRGAYLAVADWLAAPGQHQLSFTMTGQVSGTLAGTLNVPARAETGDAMHDDDTNASPSPITISLPLEAVVSIALGALAAFCVGALAAFRGRGVVVAIATRATSLERVRRWLAGLAHPLHLAAARPRRALVATVAALLVISLLLLGRGVLAGKDEAQHAMSGTVSTVR